MDAATQRELILELALRAIEVIPPGRVVSYGDLGGLVGITPRQAGAILSRHGHGVPWWRVTNASGDLPAHVVADARIHWAEEGIAWKPNGRGCRIAQYRADLVAWARAVD